MMKSPSLINSDSQHCDAVTRLQEEMKKCSAPLSLHHPSSHNTTRSKLYKGSRKKLDFGKLNRVIKIDPEKRTSIVEPRVTMEQLVAATIPYGLMPPVVPEFRGITVGGAIMGCAGESSSHRYGLFHDACTKYELLVGDGSLLTLSPTENSALFYGIPGSYGSLGALTLTEISLVPAKKNVHLTYHICSPLDALQRLFSPSADFIDGLVFSPEKAVVITGHFTDKPASPLAHNWFAWHIDRKAEETLTLSDYLFRYDQGAFWMGAYLLKFPLLLRFLLEGVWKVKKGSSIRKFHSLGAPSRFLQKVFARWLDSRTLWKIHHQADNWVGKRFIVQDFCIPTSGVADFLAKVLHHPGIFPLWLCPVKGAGTSQCFAPHTGGEAFLNVGMYGIPATLPTVELVTKELEEETHACGGRKVLYSRSYYTEEEFWKIYSKEEYLSLRTQAQAIGRWQEITEKVLAE